MDYDAIRQGLANCRFTDHARREMEAEPSGAILTSEVLEALDTGEIIEDCAEDKPYASCLVLGWTIRRRPLHLVCAPVPSERRLITITTYQPDPARWDTALRRGKGP